jgi:peptide/nickel transport system substrate-binding protein
MPPDMLQTLPGYDPDVQKNRAEARTLMEKLGYSQTGGSRSRS